MKTFLLALLLFSSLSAGVFASSPPEVSNGGILPGPNRTEVISNLKQKTWEELSEEQKMGEVEGTEKVGYGRGGQTYVIEKFVPILTSGFVAFVMSLSILMLVIAGLMYVFSSGDSEGVQKAKDVVFWTLVGSGIAIISFAMVKFVVGINFSGI